MKVEKNYGFVKISENSSNHTKINLEGILRKTPLIEPYRSPLEDLRFREVPSGFLPRNVTGMFNRITGDAVVEGDYNLVTSPAEKYFTAVHEGFSHRYFASQGVDDPEILTDMLTGQLTGLNFFRPPEFYQFPHWYN